MSSLSLRCRNNIADFADHTAGVGATHDCSRIRQNSEISKIRSPTACQFTKTAVQPDAHAHYFTFASPARTSFPPHGSLHTPRLALWSSYEVCATHASGPEEDADADMTESTNCLVPASCCDIHLIRLLSINVE